ncbi:MAG: phage protease [Bacteroidales bacterium]|jgi:hypothetical protein|nr:phage protease [Bacteroidales bacterium]
MAYKKFDKEFCLTDNSVNVYGYRLLTDGFVQERFNPAIGYFMHKRELGVAVRWEDFRVDGDKLYAKPVINESAFPNLFAEIEAGFYAGASVGSIVALEFSDDDKMKLADQTGITVTKWFPREISIVDLPGNYNALAQLYDESDNVLYDLSDKKLQKKSEMKKFELNAEQLQLLDLSDNATDDQITVALKNLADKAKRADAAEKALNDLKAGMTQKQVKAILEKGMSEHKLTKELADSLEKDYAGNPDGLQKLVDAMQPQKFVTKQTNSKVPTDLPEKYKGKSFNDLYVSGDLEHLKADYPDYYEILKSKK